MMQIKVHQDKTIRIMNYAMNMTKEIGVLAYLYGVKEPRELKIIHARTVTGKELSVALNELHPDVISETAINEFNH